MTNAWKTPAGDHYRILPRYFARSEEAARQRRIARIVLETGDKAPATISTVTLPGDPQRLRGIPCVGAGVGGVSPGTSPLAALLQRERSTR